MLTTLLNRIRFNKRVIGSFSTINNGISSTKGASHNEKHSKPLISNAFNFYHSSVFFDRFLYIWLYQETRGTA
jgi:hypothetical protein